MLKIPQMLMTRKVRRQQTLMQTTPTTQTMIMLTLVKKPTPIMAKNRAKPRIPQRTTTMMMIKNKTMVKMKT